LHTFPNELSGSAGAKRQAGQTLRFIALLISSVGMLTGCMTIGQDRHRLLWSRYFLAGHRLVVANDSMSEPEEEKQASFEKAIANYSAALKEARLVEPDGDEVVQTLAALAHANELAGRNDTAKPILEEILSICENRSPHGNAPIVSACNEEYARSALELAELDRRQEQGEKAAALYLKTISVCKDLARANQNNNQPASPADVWARAVLGLSQLYIDRGETSQAAALLLQSMKEPFSKLTRKEFRERIVLSYKKATSEEHKPEGAQIEPISPTPEQTWYKLKLKVEQSFRQNPNSTECETYALAALKQAESIPKARDKVLKSLNDLAYIYLNERKMPLALAAFQRAIESTAKGQSSFAAEDIRQSYAGLHAVYAKTGEWKEAEQNAHNWLTATRHLYEGSDWRIAEPMTAIASAENEQGRQESAIKWYRDGLAILRSVPQPSKSMGELYLVVNQAKLAELLAKRGEFDEAERLLKEDIATTADERSLNHDQAYTAVAGAVELFADKAPPSQAQRVAARWQSALALQCGTEDAKTFMAESLLADTLSRASDFTQARQKYEHCYAHLAKSLSPNDERLKRVADKLARCK
jgi:hypothetical protein